MFCDPLLLQLLVGGYPIVRLFFIKWIRFNYPIKGALKNYVILLWGSPKRSQNITGEVGEVHQKITAGHNHKGGCKNMAELNNNPRIS